tara:strand:- start:356 stop:538 length:183 start_codon:yes stop_codon:yes gene_type:complete
MNFSRGLKRIINVPFWIWIILGVILIFNNLDEFIPFFLIGIILPVILRAILFYIIDGFFK